MSQIVEELVRFGKPHNLTSIRSLMSESTIIADNLLALLVQESGATPLTPICDGNTALFQLVIQHTNVKRATHWVSVMPES